MSTHTFFEQTVLRACTAVLQEQQQKLKTNIFLRAAGVVCTLQLDVCSECIE